MPKNLTGSNPASFPPQTAPLGGEPRTAGAMEVALQNAADRSEYLRDRVIFIDPDRAGVRRERRFASVAEMKASVDMPDKSVALIDGIGDYQYDAASVLLEASPAIVTPTSVGAGAGRWLAKWNGSFNVANGIPQLDTKGKVPTSLLAAGDAQGRLVAGAVRWGIVDYQSPYYAGVAQTTSGSFVDVADPQITISGAKSGDRLKLSLTMRAYNLTGGKLGQFQLLVVKPDTTIAVVEGTLLYFDSTDTPRTVVAQIPVNLDGTHLVKLQHRQYDGGTSNLTWITLISELYRP